MLNNAGFFSALKIGAFVLLVLGAIWASYQWGERDTSRAYQTQLAQQSASHQAVLRNQAEAQASTLQQAAAEQQQLNEQAQQIGWQLIQARAELVNVKTQLKQRIGNVTLTDGKLFTGLGPDSLQLYRTALGYTDTLAGLPAANARHAEQTGQATATDSGLPPADLLAHAADYGQWCQELDARLSAFITLHQEAINGHF
ncbi:hypothetical protein HZU77_013430 [Neisseriaceae bacterium TC5R-5]|nr:hypothetical protein [Neisseriaceae bacterium TC5R-5]